MTLVARPIPPTPPQSTDGHPLPEEPYQGPGTYRPVCIDMQVPRHRINSGQEMVSPLSSGCYPISINHPSTTVLLRSTPPPVFLTTCLLNR